MFHNIFRRRTPQELRLRITIIVEPDGDGFHAFTPGMKGIHADGSTEQEAAEHAVEAIKLYLESLANHDESVAIGPGCEVQEPPEHYAVPAGAFMRHVTLQWPSLQTSGIN